MKMIDYSPKIIPLLVIRVLEKNQNKWMTVREISREISIVLTDNRVPDRRSIYDSIRMLEQTGWSIMRVGNRANFKYNLYIPSKTA